jgi:signal transduction histidine kinase
VPPPREPELAALATDVNTLAAALADTETRRTRLLGEVAHEMRTPLTALNGYIEGLIDGVFAPTPDILEAASDELRRLGRLADDLSTLSRAEEQRLDLHPADADLADLAQKAASRLAPQREQIEQLLDDHRTGDGGPASSSPAVPEHVGVPVTRGREFRSSQMMTMSSGGPGELLIPGRPLRRGGLPGHPPPSQKHLRDPPLSV